MKKLIALAMLFTSTLAGIAQITLSECDSLAKINYPLIKQYGLIEKITEFNISNASKGYLPQLGASAQATWQNAVPSFPDEMNAMYSQLGLKMAGINKDQYKVGVELTQNIWDGGNISAQKKIAEAEGSISKTSLNVEMYTITDRINNLFFGILLLKSKLEQNDQLQIILESNKLKIDALINNGVAMASDSEKISVEIITAQQQRLQIEHTLAAYHNVLGMLVQRDISKEKFVTPTPDNDMINGKFRPEIDLFNAQRNLLNTQLLAVKSSLMPRIGAFAQGYYGNPGFNMFDDMLYNKWSFNFIAGVKVQWNIGSLYTKSNNENKIKASILRIDNQQETFEFNNNLQATHVFFETVRFAQTKEKDKDIIKLRQSIREASEAKLNNGVIDVTDLLADITAENQARIVGKNNEIEYLRAMYNFKYIINK